MTAGILTAGEVAERLMAALLKSAESKDFVGSNPTLSATAFAGLTAAGCVGGCAPTRAVRCIRTLGRSTAPSRTFGWFR